ncbi:Cysteine-rich repeat secretory protein 12 [Glycine soja]|nr:Cysteine-rich repeat secretory protein 12 [Glycine soja]
MPNANMLLLFLFLLALFSAMTTPSTSAIDTFIFAGCSQPKFTPGSAYENTVNSLLTSLDKTLVTKKCGPSVGLTSDALTRRDAVLAYLQTSDGVYKTFRTSGYGDFQGVAQCTGDLSPSECQDCLSDAIQRLKTECGPTNWADIYLAKCYARYSEGGTRSRGNNNVFNFACMLLLPTSKRYPVVCGNVAGNSI